MSPYLKIISFRPARLNCALTDSRHFPLIVSASIHPPCYDLFSTTLTITCIHQVDWYCTSNSQSLIILLISSKVTGSPHHFPFFLVSSLTKSAAISKLTRNILVQNAISLWIVTFGMTLLIIMFLTSFQGVRVFPVISNNVIK